MAYYATGNIDHNDDSFKRGDEVTNLSEKDAEALLALGAVTENASDVDAVVSDPTLGMTTHPDFRSDLAPSTVPHPVEEEQARIEADQANKEAADAAAKQAADDQAKSDAEAAQATQDAQASQNAPLPNVDPNAQTNQVVQPVGGAGSAQPTPEEIAATLAATGGQQ